MAYHIKRLLRYFFFWYIVCLLCRLTFLVINIDAAVAMSSQELLLTFIHGFRLDLSMICYCCVFPVLFWLYSALAGFRSWQKKVINIYTFSLAALMLFISIADGELYIFWGQKLNAYALSFAKFPKDMLSFSSGISFGAVIIIALLQGIIVFFTYRLLNFSNGLPEPVGRRSAIIMFIVTAAFLFSGIRGSFGKAAINQSFSYFSDKAFLNHAAVNTTWNFMSSLTAIEDDHTNPYALLDEKEAREILRNARQPDSSASINILSTPAPNIVLVILEGWNPDVIGILGGEQNVTPAFNKLCDSGYLFTNFYASGNRTDKGLAAILSSQPALGTKSIITNLAKFNGLPSLPGELRQHGYHTSFMYGGQSEFANMKAFLLSAGVEKIYDLADFSLAERDAEWGVHDGALFSHANKWISDLPQPFFVSMLTLSSHEPYRVPVQSRFTGQDEADFYRNCMHYSDSCLGRFLESSKKAEWYKNTLFIIVSDHGNRLPYSRHAFLPERFRIPFLITGGALKQELRGKTDDKIRSQTDIAPGILGQLGIPAGSFSWGRNMFAGNPGYAVYTYSSGFGVVAPGGQVVFDYEIMKFNLNKGKAESDEKIRTEMKKLGQAHTQLYYDEFLKR